MLTHKQAQGFMSKRRAGFAGLLVTAAALAIATIAPGTAVSAPSVATGGLQTTGFLLLDLGHPDRVELRDSTGAVQQQQAITTTTHPKCKVSPTSGPLAALVATGGDVGLAGNGLGVRSTIWGQPCGTIKGSQSLSLALGAALDGQVITKAEVDVESWFACRLKVTWRLDGVTVGTEERKLSNRSDCGPDANTARLQTQTFTTNNNVRVQLTAPASGADEIIFAAGPHSLISIEGGVENSARGPLGTQLDTSASVFALSEVDGTLDCAGTGDNVYTEGDVTLTRIDADSPECEKIAFALTRDGNDVVFSKDLAAQPQAEFTLDIPWDVEPTTYPVDPTLIDYFDGNGLNPMVGCAGTTADPSLPGDQIPSTPAVDGWCVASQSVVLVGGGNMQVTEKLYGLADPRFGRP
jgi:hypothetical protein